MGKHSPRFLEIVDQARKSIQECTITEVRLWMESGDDFLLIDVREESEFDRGRIPSAIHLGKGVIERDIEQAVPDTRRKLVLYCGGGYRSALAAFNLQQMGYSEVISMDGGFRGWKDAGYEVDADPKNRS